MILLLKARRPLMLQDIHKNRMIQEESEDQGPSRVLHFHFRSKESQNIVTSLLTEGMCGIAPLPL